MGDNIEVRNQKFQSVVGNSVEIEKLATGFLFTEGPLWHAHDQYLLFSDMPGDHMRKWSARDGVSTFRKPYRNPTASPGIARVAWSYASTPRAS